jgi:hypothetical protein
VHQLTRTDARRIAIRAQLVDAPRPLIEAPFKGRAAP